MARCFIIETCDSWEMPFGFLTTHQSSVPQDSGPRTAYEWMARMIHDVDPFQPDAPIREGELLGDYRARCGLPGTDTPAAHHYLWIDCAWRKRPGKP